MDAFTNLGFIPGQNLSDLQFAPADIAAAEALVQQFLADTYPNLDVSSISTLYDLIVRPGTILYLLSRSEWSALRDTQSLQGVIDNPSVASEAVVDAILSNIGVTRNMGSPSTGLVQVTVNQAGTYSIPANTTFTTATGLVFNVAQAYRVIAIPTALNDLPLYPSGNGNFYFLVPVMASANGVAYQLPGSVSLTMSPALSVLILAASFGPFQGGSDDESNAALIARIPEAMSVKNMVSPISIAGTLKGAFPQVIDVSVQRMNGVVMTRNAHNLLGMKQGGYCDTYVRTSQGVLVATVSKTATLVDLDNNGNGIYSVALSRDDVPGHYFISGISAPGATGSYAILSQQKNFNSVVNFDGSPTGTAIPNAITTVTEAVGSRYQTSTAVFQIDYDASLGTSSANQFPATLPISVLAAYLPSIKDIQLYVNDPARGVALADNLVKAAVPCFIQLPPVIVSALASVTPAQVQAAIYNYINGLRMRDQSLRVDAIVAAVLGVTGVTGIQLPLRITGTVYTPAGNTITLVSEGVMEIPVNIPQGVVPENTAFFVDMADIPVSIIAV